MKIFDGEFFADSAVIVFKEQGKREYDVFVSSHLDYKKCNLPKMITCYPMSDLPEYIQGKQLIGFNNQYFDNQIVMFILDGNYTPEMIYAFSQGIIKKGREDRFFKTYSDRQIFKYFKYLDLYKINHYDNPARSTGLKKLEFSYRSSSIKDLPFDHTTILTRISQLEDLITYCCKDCNETDTCYDKTHDKIAFRQELSEEEGIPCLNWSDVKIGEHLNIRDYCRAVGVSEQELRSIQTNYNQPVKFSECIPDYIKFQTKELQDFLEEIKEIEVKADGTFEREITFKGSTYTIAKGGIHSNEKHRLIRSNDKYKLIDADISQQYPTEIIKRKIYPPHLEDIIIKKLEEGVRKRTFEYKAKAKKEKRFKTLSDAEKLKANGGFYGC